MLRPKVIFVSRQSIKKSRQSIKKKGSTLLRVDQLLASAEKFLGDKYDFSSVHIPRKPKWFVDFWIKRQKPGAIYIFSKTAARAWNQDQISKLRQKAAGICVDYVDLPLKGLIRNGFDFHLSTSYAGQLGLKDIFSKAAREGNPFSGQLRLVLHNVDSAFDNFKPIEQNKLAPVYFGRLGNTHISPLLEEKITFLDGAEKDAFDKNLQSLKNFNFHYCIRSDQSENLERRYKPFTKGFIAARCGANLIINRDVDDAEEFLGENYPYFTNSNDPEEIFAILDRAEKDFGGNDWIQALKVVRSISKRVSHSAIANQLDSVLAEFKK